LNSNLLCTKTAGTSTLITKLIASVERFKSVVLNLMPDVVTVVSDVVPVLA
jgi:hypothetical protein